MLIDCDVHISYTTLADLVPYADDYTGELIRSSGTGGLQMPTYPWMHPRGWIRRDIHAAAPDHDGSMYVAYSLDVLRARHLDLHQVAFALANPDEAACFAVLPNPRLAAGLCSAYNDWLDAEWLQREPRLRGSIVVPAQDPVAAAREIRRVAARGRSSTVFLPGAARIPYGSPLYDPIWEAAAELDLPVAVHVHYEGVGVSVPLTGAGTPEYYTEFHTLNGVSLGGHLVSMLCSGVFERFPRARVVLMEGGVVPFIGWLWRLDQNWRATYTEIPWCRRLPSEYVADHVRFTTQPLEDPGDPELLAGVLRALDPERTLLFASDFPHWDFDEPTATLRSLPAAWQEPIRWRNAAALLNLPVDAPVGT